jgi:4-aminobutyrate aminotransferase
LETIALLEEGLIDHAARVGEFLRAELRKLAEKHQLIGDVRGLGLMVGMELVRDRGTKEPAVRERETLIQKCFQKGLLLLGCGASTVRFCPPLVVTEENVRVAIEILDRVLTTEIEQN